MKIRFAKLQDLKAIMELGQKMMAESRFDIYSFNAEKTQRLIKGMLTRQPATDCILLAESNDGALVGMLAGYMVDFFFCDGSVVQDRVYYVLPEYRGTSAAFKLILAFRRWAESKRASELSINMSVAIDMPRFNKFMNHLGFSCCGSNFAMQLKYTASTERYMGVGNEVV
jgi:GNAT superfamily N-acetyltransferase